MAKRRVYWDAAAFLALLQREEGRLAKCRAVMEAAESGDLVIVTSSITLVEVVHLDRAKKMNARSEKMIADFFRNEFIEVWAAGRLQTEHARQLLWKNRAVGYKDAIHL